MACQPTSASFARCSCRLFRFGEIFYRVQLAVAFGYTDAYRIHVAIQDVALVSRGLHEALVNGLRVRPLVDVLRNPAEVSSVRSCPGEEIGLTGKLVRNCSLLRHALGMGASSVGQGFVPLQRRQSVGSAFLIYGVK